MESEKASERLNLFKSTSDGFKIAEFDYQLRGSGDFLGTRQSGKFPGEIKNLHYTQAEIFLAKKLADETFDSNADKTELKRLAAKKYERLKDIVLN
jgi:ATP-dependent DNA helicase RecG